MIDSSLSSTLGGLGLFLLGMVVMTNGLRSMAGDSVRRTIAKFTTSTVSGVATGASITALIQSSSATTVTAVGFAGAGLLSLSQALGIIFGANLGTTITGWIVAIFGFKLKLGTLALPLVLLGTIAHLFTKARWSAAGLAIAGFGLVFVGIDLIQSGMSEVAAVITPESFPDDTWTGRLLLVLIGITITLVTQSSSAGVAMALAAVHAGAISFPQAAAMVIGFDVGTTVTAAIAGLSGSIDARRVGLAHVVYNMMTGVGAFLLLTPYVWACDLLFAGGAAGNPELSLVGFHTLFNGLGVVVAMPFTGPFAKLIVWLIPQRGDQMVRRLDRSLYASPSVAMLAAQTTLAEIAARMLEAMRLRFRTFESGETLGPDPEFEHLRKTLGQVSGYLHQIRLQDTNAAMLEHLQHTFLAIDHLRRLSLRCDEFRRLEATRDVPILRDHLAQVGEQAQQILTALDQPLGKELQQSAKTLFKSFADSCDEDRRLFSQSVAKGEIDPDAGIAQLDSLRWLRRISFHLWRIVRHLRHARFENQL